MRASLSPHTLSMAASVKVEFDDGSRVIARQVEVSHSTDFRAGVRFEEFYDLDGTAAAIRGRGAQRVRGQPACQRTLHC